MCSFCFTTTHAQLIKLHWLLKPKEELPSNFPTMDSVGLIKLSMDSGVSGECVPMVTSCAQT